MASDNVAATPGSGATFRFFADGNGVEWGGAILAYITGGSAGAWTTQNVQLANVLPVQPQTGATWAATQSGTWTVQPGNTANTTPWLASINAGGNTATVKAASTAIAATDL